MLTNQAINNLIGRTNNARGCPTNTVISISGEFSRARDVLPTRLPRQNYLALSFSLENENHLSGSTFATPHVSFVAN